MIKLYMANEIAVNLNLNIFKYVSKSCAINENFNSMLQTAV